MPDNMGKFSFLYLGQILRCKTDLSSDLAAADIDLLLCLCAFIDSGHVLLYNANGSTAAADITGNGVNVLYVDHFHALFPY